MRSEKRDMAILLILLLIGMLTRLYGLTHQSIWIDEGSTFFYSHYTWDQFYTANEPNSPVYYMMEGFILDALGQNEFALRIGSAIIGGLCVPMAYLLARKLFQNRICAIAMALMTLCSTTMLFYGQEARGFILVVFLVMCQMYLLIKALESRNNWKFWILLSIVSAIQLSMHFSGIIATVLIYLYSLTYCLWNHREYKADIFKTLLSGIPFVLISTPLISFALDTFRIGTSHEHWEWCFIGVPYLLNALSEFLFCELSPIFIAMFILGLVLLIRKPVNHANLLVLTSVVPLLVTTAMSYSMNMTPRYILWSAISCQMVVAYAFATVIEEARKHQNVKWISTIILLAILLAPAIQVPDYYEEITKEDFRAAAKAVQENAQPGDVMVYAVNSENSVLASIRFYYEPTQHGVTVIGYQGEEQLRQLSVDPAYGDVYVVILDRYEPVETLSEISSPNCTNICPAYRMNVFKITGQYW